MSLDVERLEEALRLGVGAYLVEEAEADELASVIRQVPEGGASWAPELNEDCPRARDGSPLSR